LIRFWDQIQTESPKRGYRRSKPLIGALSTLRSCIIKSIEKALFVPHRARAAVERDSMIVVHEMVEQAFASDPT